MIFLSKAPKESAVGIIERLIRLARSEINEYMERMARESQSTPDPLEEEIKDAYQPSDSESRRTDDGTSNHRSRERKAGHQHRYGTQKNKVIARHYANLEIPYGSDWVTVKSAWRKLMRKYHPDLYQGDPKKRETATRLTQELTRSYQALKEYLKS